MTGDGEIVTARPDNEHSDLYYGFPNSYGTLGYALRMTIELEPVRALVRLHHVPFDDAHRYFAAVAEICATGLAGRARRLPRRHGLRPRRPLPHDRPLTDDAPYTS